MFILPESSATELFQVSDVIIGAFQFWGEVQDKKLPAQSQGSPCWLSDKCVGKSKAANWVGSSAPDCCWHIMEKREKGSPCPLFFAASELQGRLGLCIDSRYFSVVTNGPGQSRLSRFTGTELRFLCSFFLPCYCWLSDCWFVACVTMVNQWKICFKLSGVPVRCRLSQHCFCCLTVNRILSSPSSYLCHKCHVLPRSCPYSTQKVCP